MVELPNLVLCRGTAKVNINMGQWEMNSVTVRDWKYKV